MGDMGRAETGKKQPLPDFTSERSQSVPNPVRLSLLVSLSDAVDRGGQTSCKESDGKLFLALKAI